MVDVPRTRFRFDTIGEWIELHHGRLMNGLASRQEYARRHAIFQALRTEMLARSRDLPGLKRLDVYLRAWTGVGTVRFDAGLNGRGHYTALLMATHNRIHQLETGAADRDRVRHGPADPVRMPDRALDRVIQTCRNMELVERCRAERAARLARAA